MAATGSKVRGIFGSFGKRLTDRILATKPLDPAPFAISRRGSHFASHYDKELEEQVRVPDHVIDAGPYNYWGPHPTTGVFGPADLNGAATGNAAGSRYHKPPGGGEGTSALDLTVRFRPLDLEDLDKSHHA